MSGHVSPSPTKDFPPLLRHLVQAAQAECPPAHAEALVRFIGLAVQRQSSYAVVDRRASSELDAAIEAMARAHFDIDDALAAWRRAHSAVLSAIQEDASPAGSGVRQDDAASFYAGLAFGLVFGLNT